jgi:transcription-repair coupling factor (superfamily II helicase)
VFDPLERHPVFARALAGIERTGRAEVGGLWGSSAALFLAAMLGTREGSVVLVTPTVEEAEDLRKDLVLLGIPDSAMHSLLPVDAGDGSEIRSDALALSRNLRTLRAVADRADRRIVVVPLPAAVRGHLPPERLASTAFELRAGMPLDRDRWVERLDGSGLDRVSLVVSPGEFSVRGDIVDVFPFSEERPLRLEFDGDRLDSIRPIDPSTQRSVEIVSRRSLPLIGARDLVAAAGGGVGLDSYLRPDDLLVLRDPLELRDRLARYEASSVGGWLQGGARGTSHPRLFLSSLPVSGPGTAGNFSVGSITAEGPNLAAAFRLLARLADACRHLILLCQNDAEASRFATLVERELPRIHAKLHIRTGDVSRGFQFRDLGLTLLDHHELFHRVRPKRREVPEPAPSLPVDDFLDLEEGDFVVHAFHGIARYRGLTRMKSGEADQEFLTLEFRDGVLLYVPVAKIHLVERYVGSKGYQPKLNRLGGSGWSRKKKIVEDSVTEFAVGLLEVQAMRARKKGIAYPTDTEWQHEFEAAFPFKDTPDQHEASMRIKRDMESARPMDRLVCGDVGYGKTELAIRASFKAVESGKQVAVLVPTTVLAQQHFQTFRERTGDYPVEIEVLSRFRTRREQKEILERASEGKIDILIGTHRLLQPDVRFRDLGLVIIDEEQRFGVEHKERLMRLRATVDLLTLTATPIPRTLHMALVNLRDISTLQTPPQGRQSIVTRIAGFDEEGIRRAILFELERDGQVYFVHNRVKSIDRMKERLEEIVPIARIEVVHGQMHEHLIEERMTRFVEGKVDVLLTTTIIESGLDIPNANTMFIDRADRFGLAELHQLRGRIGRYRNRAFAYLLVPPRASISTDAKKRLKAIEEFSELGSGFRIAMRDLEIRGTGNLLGPQQHGHIAAIGYDLYCKLLRRAVRRLRGEALEPEVELDVDLGVPAFVPADYIEDMRQKIEVYQRISALEHSDGIAPLRRECRDRFGPLPRELDNLLWVARARMALRGHGVTDLKRRGSRLILTCPEGRVPSGLLGRPISEVRWVDGRVAHLLLPPGCDDPSRLVEGLERALSGEGFF